MVMALSLLWRHEFLFLLAGYENGLAVVARRRHGGAWDIIYRCQAHSQPILSLDYAPDKESFLSSGADATIAKHPIPHANTATPPVPGFKTARNPETEGLEEPNAALPSAGLAPTSASGTEAPPRGLPRNKVAEVVTSPLKVINTKHSGQQGLHVRSDGRIFATAGWDARVRVYSTKTMAELAVLKWHDVGCYAAAFASLSDDGQSDVANEPEDTTHENITMEQTNTPDDASSMRGMEMAITTPDRPGELSVKDRRIKMAKDAHWLAAGSKDGKISLWDIY